MNNTELNNKSEQIVSKASKILVLQKKIKFYEREIEGLELKKISIDEEKEMYLKEIENLQLQIIEGE